MTILVLDNISTSTNDILLCLKKLKVNYTCKKFYENIDLEVSSFERVILSGRSRPRRDINVTNSKLVLKSSLLGIPIMGICYGAEIMALALGGTIRRLITPVCQMSFIQISDSPEAGIIFQRSRSLYAYESHAYCIATMPKDFVSIAASKHCKNEVIVDIGRKLVGIQFHPERSDVDGLALFSTFLNM